MADECANEKCGWTGTDDQKDRRVNKALSSGTGAITNDLVCPDCGNLGFYEIDPSKIQGEDAREELYNEALNFVARRRLTSISALQREFRIGYNRAARLQEILIENGIVSAEFVDGLREVLISAPAR